MENSKKAIQSKTLWFNILSIIAILIAHIQSTPELKELVGNYGYLLMLGGALVNAILRTVTTKAIKSDPIGAF